MAAYGAASVWGEANREAIESPESKKSCQLRAERLWQWAIASSPGAVITRG
jgi:hypothetical protein